ncbi:hypothetical protein WCT92_20165 [Dickeya dadantii]|uniref:hypothetical protein n=1 Tax=Dickeya dadantii TaxID=204038 RepID=UPI003018D86F
MSLILASSSITSFLPPKYQPEQFFCLPPPNSHLDVCRYEVSLIIHLYYFCLAGKLRYQLKLYLFYAYPEHLWLASHLWMFLQQYDALLNLQASGFLRFPFFSPVHSWLAQMDQPTRPDYAHMSTTPLNDRFAVLYQCC